MGAMGYGGIRIGLCVGPAVAPHCTQDCKLRFWHPNLLHSLGSCDIRYGGVWSLAMRDTQVAAGCSEGLLVGDVALHNVEFDVPTAKKQLFKAKRRTGGRR